MADREQERRHYPTWVRAVLVGLQALGVVGGVMLGALTYDAWSQPADSRPTSTTTTAVPTETEVLPVTLG
ncbi:MAG TPA: hypothetical protein VID94_06015 [Acidimicrobiales bacterium]